MEKTKMKTAITAASGEITGALDGRFGRASKFIIYETDTGEFSVIDNAKNLEAAQGAGIQSAQNVIDAGASAVITGHMGPKAFKLLRENNITVYCTALATVKEAIDAYKAGKLTEALNADVESHW